MQARVTDRPVEQVIAAIQALNLEPIKFKLMDREEGQGWSREYADRMELGYKRFLTLLVTHPEETLAPSKEVDRFWHGHILDTLKYEEDCAELFGRFLHHFPYFGMRGAEDAANLARAAETTRRLYREEFGSAKNDEVTTQSAAMCAAAVRAGDAAMCAAAVRAGDAAMCAAAVRPGDAAMCAAAVRPGDAAMCAAAVRAGDAAMCAAAVRLNNSNSAGANAMAS